MVSQATTIKNSIESNWALTGTLSKTPTATVSEVVRFYDRPQVKGNEWPKAVTVIKINNDLEEGIVEHPNFTEVTDIYEIELYYRVQDVQVATYSDALNDVELMGTELLRILKLSFSPSTGVGGYFVSRWRWYKEDLLSEAQPELRRLLRLELTQLISETDTVFRGFDGIMIYDTSASEGDSKPGSDYTYTELREVDITEGNDQIAYLTKDVTKGVGVPQLARGLFRGIFSALIMGKKEDIINAGTTNLISEVYKVQTSSPIIGQVPETVFFHNTPNLESSPVTLQTKSFMRVDHIVKLASDESLLTYRISGKLSRPTEYATL